MTIVNMHDAKSQLSDLVARAEAGEEIVIARRNLPAVRLVPVKVEVPSPDALAGAVGPPQEIDPWEHAPDDYISKEDIAAFYRKYPHEWTDMLRRVGFAEEKQAKYDLTGLRKAVAAGKEYTIMQDGKPVAKVAPQGGKGVTGFGALAHLPPVPDEFFFDPLPDDELDAWEGKYSTPEDNGQS